MAAVSWLLPPAAWRGYARAIGVGQRLLGRSESAALARKVALVADVARPDRTSESIVSAHVANRIEARLHAVASWRPGGWHPEIAVEGVDHIDCGLAAGNGAILWVADFVFHGLVSKIGLSRAGYDVSHLSGPRHGWSSTRFGVRVINPVQTGAEARFLKERVIMSDLDLPTPYRVVAAMRALRKRLSKNGVVSISALTSDWGPEDVDFYRGRIRLASGPPSLAHASGAPLLPVFAFRDESGFRVVVEPPICMRADLDRQEAASFAASDYARLLAGYVKRYPEQWMGWRFLREGER